MKMDNKQIIREVEEDMIKYCKSPYNFFTYYYNLEGLKKDFNYDLGLIIDKVLKLWGEGVKKKIIAWENKIIKTNIKTDVKDNFNSMIVTKEEFDELLTLL